MNANCVYQYKSKPIEIDGTFRRAAKFIKRETAANWIVNARIRLMHELNKYLPNLFFYFYDSFISVYATQLSLVKVTLIATFYFISNVNHARVIWQCIMYSIFVYSAFLLCPEVLHYLKYLIHGTRLECAIKVYSVWLRANLQRNLIKKTFRQFINLTVDKTSNFNFRSCQRWIFFGVTLWKVCSHFSNSTKIFNFISSVNFLIL